jgi:hypothetical protein
MSVSRQAVRDALAIAKERGSVAVTAEWIRWMLEADKALDDIETERTWTGIVEMARAARLDP